MEHIAVIHNDLKEKFGIPRQSGIVEDLASEIVFEPAYRDPDMIRGLSGFSHIWLIWEFSQSAARGYKPVVRPPRLGGNVRQGIFATRSPFRPNPIGLSSVRLREIKIDPELGPVLTVCGADLMDGTPVFDIKPYIHADCHDDCRCGFSDTVEWQELKVDFPADLLADIPAEKRSALLGMLAQDPRPAYQDDPDRIYGMSFSNLNIRFCVRDDTVHVVSVS